MQTVKTGVYLRGSAHGAQPVTTRTGTARLLQAGCSLVQDPADNAGELVPLDPETERLVREWVAAPSIHQEDDTAAGLLRYLQENRSRADDE